MKQSKVVQDLLKAESDRQDYIIRRKLLNKYGKIYSLKRDAQNRQFLKREDGLIISGTAAEKIINLAWEHPIGKDEMNQRVTQMIQERQAQDKEFRAVLPDVDTESFLRGQRVPVPSSERIAQMVQERQAQDRESRAVLPDVDTESFLRGQRAPALSSQYGSIDAGVSGQRTMLSQYYPRPLPVPADSDQLNERISAIAQAKSSQQQPS